MTRGELIAELATSLGARHEARFIVEEVLGSTPALDGRALGTADVDAIRSLAALRRDGEPLQYVLGHWAFRCLDLLVDRRVLIPRPETEEVVEVALGEVGRLAAAPVIVDAGTGSGAIALSMATELADRCPEGRLWATDASAEALVVASANRDRVRRQRGGHVLPVTFAQGSWLSPLPRALTGLVDLIVSNPPYVAVETWPDLPEVVRCEPPGALVAGPGTDGTPGLREVEEVLSQARGWLSRPGAVVIELAPQQSEAAIDMARRMGYLDARVERDLAGRPRTLVGRVR
ncbi:MAG: N5-glutamine methyltransferase family protein [Acidimicrobiales bacterium]